MAGDTRIEWCDSTFNPWIGCTRVSPACDDCYAARSTPARTLAVAWGPHEPRLRTSAANWELPLRWERQHAKFFAEHGRRRRVFCASLADVFDNTVPPEWRRDLFELIRVTSNLDWLLLTKRIGNVEPMVMEALLEMFHRTNVEPPTWPWPNVWLGNTVVNQAEADRDIPRLLAMPAAVRFLSIEPMLGPIDLRVIDIDGHSEIYPLRGTTECEDEDGNATPDLPRIDWVIVGGESGPHARPMHPDWARSLRDQCAAAGVPYLFKQWGEWLPGQNELHPNERGRRIAHHQDGCWGATATRVTIGNYVVWSKEGHMHRGSLAQAGRFEVDAWAERVGKKAAGRLLDGLEHNGFPMVRS